METHEITYTLDTINSVANDLHELLPLISVMTFTGPLGVGKTSLIRALLNNCDIEADVQSPTFTYLNIYSNAQEQAFYHFDLYRLKSQQDFVDAGFEEYLYQPKSWALIEWPEIIMPLLTKRVCHFTLEYAGEDRRVLRYNLIV